MKSNRSPWAWIPSLYFAEGLPYVVVMTLSIVMYKRLGLSNTDIAIYTSWLNLPWVIKPIWSPIVDMFKTKRWWITLMQLIIGAGFAGIALTIPAPQSIQYTLLVFWLIAFSSATHDIAADGFYMLGLEPHQQAYFIGIRSTFYRIAMITGQGLLVIVAGFFESYTGLEPIRFTVNAVIHEQAPNNYQEQNSDSKSAFIISDESIYIETVNITKEMADSTMLAIKNHNREFGFVLPEEKAMNASKNPGWWSVHVSKPLSGWLKKRFGREEMATLGNQKGSMAFVGIRLREKPQTGKDIVLNINQRGGDNSIRLVEGERLTFTSQNWDQEAFVLWQLDPKLDKLATARFEGRSGNIPKAWSITFWIMAGMFLCIFLYHRFYLPYPDSDQQVLGENRNFFKEFIATFGAFFSKKFIVPALMFTLLFRFGEAQLIRLASPFLLDDRALGGLGLTTGDVGLVYGTIGMIALVIGGILGGIVISKTGLRYWIYWMALAINIPTSAYVYMAVVQPDHLGIISACVAFEQFGYGFGSTAYALYLIYFCEGRHKTAHYALCTGFMALGMMIPGMFSGWVQEAIGYTNFFVWTVLCGIPALLVIKFLGIDPKFGLKKANSSATSDEQ